MCSFGLACVKMIKRFLSITIIFSTVERVSESKSESLLFSGSTLEVLISGSPTITFFHHSIWLHLVSNTDTVLPSSARVTKYHKTHELYFQIFNPQPTDPFFKISIAIINELFPPINITCEKSCHMHSVRQILPKKPKTPSINFRRRKK